MTKTRQLLAAALLGLALSPISHAAQAPHSPDELTKDASHIVVGLVVQVDFKWVAAPGSHGLGFRNRNYALQIKLESVAKGDGIKAGDTITVHAWRPAKSLRRRPPGPQGHYPLPAKGGHVKVYLQKGGEKYLVIHPNGFEPVKPEAKP